MKLAILLPNWVGDACMATPAIRAIRTELRDVSELCIIGRPAPVMVLEGLPWVDSSLTYRPRSKGPGMLSRRGLVSELRSRSFDAMLLLPNSLSSGLIAYLSGIRRRIGFAKDGRSFLLTDRVSFQEGDINYRRTPCIDAYLRLAKELGCRSQDRTMELFCTENDRDMANQLWRDVGFSDETPTVLFNTAAATASAKQWPTDQAIRTAKTLAHDYGVQVLIHCGPADRDRANVVEFSCDHPLVKSMGKFKDLPLGLSKGVIEKSALVLSTDSGPRHMAVAMNKKVISLFGPTDPALTQTFNVPETVMRHEMSCQPCGKYECPLVHTNCMHGLQHSRVVAEIVSELQLATVPRSEPSIVELGRLGVPRTAA